MPRQLSEVEKLYIEEHRDKENAKEMAAKMKGVGPKTIQEYMDTLPPPAVEGESHQERQRKLQSTRVGVGRLMGRDADKGVVVMTEAASELSDARRTVAVPNSKERQDKMKDKIHRPFEDSQYDR